jgi:hypothetical protein
MIKTMELLNETPEPEVLVPPRESQPEDISITDQQYNWSEDTLYGWVYADSTQTTILENQWIYTESLDWIWVFDSPRNFSYSANYGWLYTRIYMGEKVVYWYDKRMWMIPSAHMIFD